MVVILVIIGDLHYGVSRDDPWIQNIQSKSTDQVIEYCVKNGIKDVIQTGDWFDVRKWVTHVTMEFSRKNVEKYLSAGINLHIIIGNHDLHYKNTIHPNSVSELLSRYPNVKIYDKPTTVDFDGVLFDMIPWMCETNTSDILEHIKTSNAEYCVGHWELNGFYFYKGMKSHGLEPDFLKKYKQVYSGHFHTISSASNIQYVGTPYSITAGDENDPRGFWDFNDGELKFIENPVMWHQKIYYPCNIDVKDYTDLAVRLVVSKPDDKLADFESSLEKVVHSLHTISPKLADVQQEEVDVEVKSLDDLISKYIFSLDSLKKPEMEIIHKYAIELKNEAQS